VSLIYKTLCGQDIKQSSGSAMVYTWVKGKLLATGSNINRYTLRRLGGSQKMLHP
jgi:hypothetical protein